MDKSRLIGWTVGVAAVAATAGFTGAVVSSAAAGQDVTMRAEARPAEGEAGVLARLREAGYTTVLELEREDGGYEAKVLDADGRRREIYLDASTTARPGRERPP